MADEPEGTPTAAEPEQAEPTADFGFASEGDLARVFQDTSHPSPLEPDVEAEAAKEAEPATTTPPVEDSRFTELQAKIDAAHERAVAAETRANILEARQNSQRQQSETPAAVEEPFTFDKFREEVAKDPATAIFKLFEKATSKQEGLTTQAVEQAKQQAVGVIQQQNAFESDRATMVAEYGSLMNSDKKFADLANTVYSQMTGNSPVGPNGNRWHPGAMYAAASIAYAQLAKSGQLVDPNRKVVRMEDRKPKPSSPLLGNDRNAEPTRTSTSDIPARDLAIMKKTANSMGITLDKYLASMEALKKNNPYYGTGQ